MVMCSFNLCLLAVLFCVFCGPLPSVSVSTLYDQDAPIAQLNADTFPGTIVGSRFAWIVEFYATWCGHCQRFAPTWLRFAHDVKGWDDVIRVAAVPCSEPSNAPLCRRVNIWGYPTIKFFEPNSPPNSAGYNYQGSKSAPQLGKASIEFVQTLIGQGKAPQHWPKLSNFEHGRDIWETYPTAGRAFLIVADETDNAFLPQQVILDTVHVAPHVVVGRLSETGVPSTYIQRPALFSVDRSGTLYHVPSALTRAEMANIIRLYEDDGQGDELEPTGDRPHSTASYQTTTFPFQPSDGLHMQDVESNLYYSFWVEIGAHRTIRSQALQALKDHLRVMAKYHPGNDYVRNFLNKTENWLQGVTAPLSGQNWLEGITELQTSDAYVPDRVRWTGCEGSEPRFRGYPCSLWMIFHALTVNALKNAQNDPNFDPQEVLKSMRGYIRYFMGCRNCAGHFARMAATIEEDVRSPSDGVLWLWKAHNRVNNRLHGDYTEDPRHQKIQFPAFASCPMCRSDNLGGLFHNLSDWEYSQVLAYMDNFYGTANIIQDAQAYSFEREESAHHPIRSTRVLRTVRPTEVHLPTTTPGPTQVNQPQPSCQVTNTNWTPCSRTCNAGVSTRLSNDNQACRMEMEMRICNLRPCRANFGDWTSPLRREQCPRYGKTYRAARPIPLKFMDCYTLARAQWRYCGLCPGKCCFPTSWNNTVVMDISCGQNRVIGKVNVHQILACQCSDSCPTS